MTNITLTIDNNITYNDIWNKQPSIGDCLKLAFFNSECARVNNINTDWFIEEEKFDIKTYKIINSIKKNNKDYQYELEEYEKIKRIVLTEKNNK